MKIIAVTTQKGGVGKTTSAINIAASLSEKGKRVLLVDLDPQGNATIGCGIDNNGIETIVKAMQADISGTFTVKDLSIIKREKFDVLPSDITLSNLELMLVSAIGRELVLKRVLEPIKEAYDYIIIDTLPSLGILTVNALAVSDYVIVPILAKDYYSLQGFDALMIFIDIVTRSINSNLKKLGEVITMYDGRNKNDNLISDTIRDDDRTNVFNTVIPLSTKAAEANRMGKTILEHDVKGRAAMAYRTLTDEILDRMEG